VRLARAGAVPLAAWILLLALPAGAQSWRVTTTLENESAWRTRSPKVLQKSRSKLWVDAEAELAPSLEVRGIGRVLYDPVRRIWASDQELDREPVDVWTPGSEVEVELRELYLDWHERVRRARLDLRVGKQQVVWGHSLGLRVLDFVNPMDFREFVLEPFVDSRITTIGARAELTLPGMSLEAIVFPDFESDLLPDPSGEYALEQELPGFLPFLAPFAGPGSGFLVDLRGPDEPSDWSLDTWGFGLHGSTVVSGWDLALYYWDRYDPRPAFSRRVVPSAALGGFVNEIRAEHFRVRSLGASFSTAWRDFTFWGEGAASHGVGFVTKDPSDTNGLDRHDEVQYALGADWTGVDHLFANLQLLQFVVLDHDSDLEVDEFRTFLSLLLRFDARNETLFPQLFVMYGTNEKDFMIRPSVELRVTDRLTLALGADLFTGPREGLFGQYARSRRCLPVAPGAPVPQAGGCAFDEPPGRTSRVFLRVRYSFTLGS
jgi:hypothetical protein